MMNQIRMWTSISLAVLVSVVCGGCGGGSGEGAAPSADISGHWKLTDTSTNNTCDEEIGDPYMLKLTESGDVLSVFYPEVNQTFSGKIGAGSIQWKGSYPEDGGTRVLETVEATVTGDSLSGTSTWSWSDGFDSCSGTTQFSGRRQ